jgi:CRP-like cAMP-binding protein
VVTAIGVFATLVLTEARARPPVLDADRARLLAHPILAGLPAPRLEAAAGRLVEVPMASGEAIVREGDEPDRFYLVADGSLRVTQGPDGTHLRDLGPGDVFGEIGLLRRTPRSATVTALTPGRLLALDADAFSELVGSGPGLSTRLLDLYRGAGARA